MNHEKFEIFFRGFLYGAVVTFICFAIALKEAFHT